MAHALNLMCEHPELANSMEELDNVKVPNFDTFECDASKEWHRN